MTSSFVMKPNKSWYATIVRSEDPNDHRTQLLGLPGFDSFCRHGETSDWWVTIESWSLVAPQRWHCITGILIIDDRPRGSLTVYPGETTPGPWMVRVPKGAQFNMVFEFYKPAAPDEIVSPALMALRLTRMMSHEV